MTWQDRPRGRGPGGLCYVRAGEGPPLVLIHGVGLRAEAWGAMAPILARHFSVFAVDLPGHGGSALGAARTLADHVARVLEFADALDGPVRVAGHSMGAMIALEAAMARPDKFCGLAALNAIYRRSARAARAVQQRAAALTGEGGADPVGTLARWFGTAPDGAGKAAADACATWLRAVDPQGYARAYRVFAHHDGPSEAELTRLPVPALFITGARDPNSTPAMSQAMAGLVPDGRVRVLEKAAHMMPMTHPHEVCAALLQRFREAER